MIQSLEKPCPCLDKTVCVLFYSALRISSLNEPVMQIMAMINTQLIRPEVKVCNNQILGYKVTNGNLGMEEEAGFQSNHKWSPCSPVYPVGICDSMTHFFGLSFCSIALHRLSGSLRYNDLSKSWLWDRPMQCLPYSKK